MAAAAAAVAYLARATAHKTTLGPLRDHWGRSELATYLTVPRLAVHIRQLLHS